MKKPLLTTLIAVSMTGATATPAMAADDSHAQWIPIKSISMPIYRSLMALLYPAVQSVRG